jgi:sec-independent protein translocase protein TatA
MLPFNIGFGEMAMIGVIAVMLFGSRLPEVAGQLGKSYQQFRKGLDEIKSNIKTDVDLDINGSTNHLPDYSQQTEDDYDAPSSPVFDAPEEEE